MLDLMMNKKHITKPCHDIVKMFQDVLKPGNDDVVMSDYFENSQNKLASLEDAIASDPKNITHPPTHRQG